MKDNIQDIQILDEIITGRVAPHIYAFTTNTVPNYLKVGDTYRPVSMRLREWSQYFPELEKTFEGKAVVTDDVYFRDFSVHQFLEKDLHKHRLELSESPPGIYFSKEFFHDTLPSDVQEAIFDIKEQYKDNTGKYVYYDSRDRLPEEYHYKRGPAWQLRPNQQQTVNNFQKALAAGRTNLLMYAVMRFGKSFTSLSCAKAMDAKVILILSAKADVKEEWKKTVESAGNFEGYTFLCADELSRDENAIQVILDNDETAAIFLTLQDLQGEQIKDKHKEIFKNKIDLLIVDETHFGARAQEYGRVLKEANQKVDDKETLQKTDDDQIGTNEAEEQIKSLNAKIRLHLSGTPYRILMGSEFEKEDIISFVQFADIVHEQESWDEKYLANDDVNEWDNPYYGFPQMVRFAFNPNKSSIQKMEALKKLGVTFAFSALFEPRSIKQDRETNLHKKFQNEAEILDLLKVIDGSKADDGLLGFLDYEKLKEGKMCRHMVMVLPYCASCDAMEELIHSHKDEFKNLHEYKIINISGVEGSKSYRDPRAVKLKIRECESNNQKTLTLTVNRMLTGSTVEQWDTMLYFKDTASPQEYDQAIFRLQNQYTRELISEEGVIRENLKPQTLLVDFDPNRMFNMQEQKSLIYNVNTDENGNSKLKERLQEELRISPIITMNHNKIHQVEATNILEVVSAYNNQRSIFDEVRDVPVDLGILSDADILRIIEAQSEFGSKGGLSFKPIEGEGDDLDVDDPDDVTDTTGNQTPSGPPSNSNEDEERSLEKKVQTYYQRILFFAFLSKDQVSSLSDIVLVLDQGDNLRLARNLGLNKSILQKMNKMINAFKLSNLDYKIQNISMLSDDMSVTPLDRALTSLRKFNRMSESEIITPSNVCDDMISLMPAEGLKSIIANDEKLLDIASKSGEYAVALYKRLTTELGFSREQIYDSIYSIPTSSIAYEFTRRFYEILELNTENIATKFTAYDLLKIEDDDVDRDCNKASRLIKQKKPFSRITLSEEMNEGDDTMKFGAVVGNPPYQENISDNDANTSLSKQLFPHFIELSIKTSSKYVSLITPARWFTGDAQDKSFLRLRQFIRDNNHISTLYYYEEASDVFENVEIKGGVCYCLYDKDHIGNVDFTINKDGITSTENRQLFVEGLDVVISNNKSISVLLKIINESFLPLTTITKGRNAFGIIGKPSVVNSVSSTTKFNGACELRCKANVIRYISPDKVTKNTELFRQYKVFISKSAGAPNKDRNVIGVPYFAQRYSACTDSLIPIGGFETASEAQNLQKYIKTKFLRFLVAIVKASQNVTQIVYRFVPLQDFTTSSDIDWSQNVDDIDEQLFTKYGLTDDEKQHIRISIKEMA